MELMIYIWAGLIVFFLIVEAACPIHLVSIWFAAGALSALLACWLQAELWVQITGFILVSGILLALLWPLVRKYMNPKLQATNVDAVIGTLGYVTEPIDNLNAAGQVKLGGMYWTARSTSGENIPAGTKIRVDRIEGVKVFVAAVETVVTV